MDVARRDRDEPRRDPGAAEVIRVSVSVRAPTYDLDRAGDLLLFGRMWLSLTEPIEDDLRGAYELPPRLAA